MSGNFGDIKQYPFVDLKLTTKFKGEVHKRAGLNWGQRPQREPNQAYIPVLKKVHQDNPGFFPQKEYEFDIHTDDGEILTCIMAQDNRKAIETCNNNSILGVYFRNRLGVPLGDYININHLNNYGRDYVRIYKIDSKTYYMDFS